MNKTAQTITAAKVAFGMNVKYGVRNVRARMTILAKTIVLQQKVHLMNY